MLALGQRVTARLAAEALDPSAPLAMADRLALAALSLAIEAEVALRAGAKPHTAEAVPALAAALVRDGLAELQRRFGELEAEVGRAARGACTGPDENG